MSKSYLVLSSQKEFVNNVNIQEPLGSSDHVQLEEEEEEEECCLFDQNGSGGYIKTHTSR